MTLKYLSRVCCTLRELFFYKARGMHTNAFFLLDGIETGKANGLKRPSGEKKGLKINV